MEPKIEKFEFLTLSHYMQQQTLPVLTEKIINLSDLIGIKFPIVIAGGQNNYNLFRVQRKQKKSREIFAPCDELKNVQQAILQKILLNAAPHPAATAFYRGNSIFINARQHHRCVYLYKTDIRNFFSSITSDVVRSVIKSRFQNIAWQVIDEIVQLVTLNGVLPLGAPTSPHLSNLALFEFDDRVYRTCQKIGARYTRYADDISVSANDMQAIEIVIDVIEKGFLELGMSQHPAKTRIFGPNANKTVTGLDVSGSTIRPPRNYRKKTASLVRMCEIYPERMKRHIYRVLGHLSHWHGVSPNDPELQQLEQRMKVIQR